MSPAIALTAETAPPAAEGAPANQQHLAFALAGEVFAIEILCIKEIISYGQITRVPTLPPFVRGVINLRGSVVPVIDLAARFGRDATEIARRTCIVIIEADDGHEFGLMVDAVNEVVDIPAAQIEPPPAFGGGIRSDFIRGMGKLNERFAIILDLDRVLSLDEMAMLASGAAAPSNASNASGATGEPAARAT